jgi:hypothetical protein
MYQWTMRRRERTKVVVPPAPTVPQFWIRYTYARKSYTLVVDAATENEAIQELVKTRVPFHHVEEVKKV